MTKSIAQSLIEMRKFDPKDIAKRFALEYNKEPKRGYGANVVDVFAALMLANYESPYEPAKRQFGGFGSYGMLNCFENFNFFPFLFFIHFNFFFVVS